MNSFIHWRWDRTKKIHSLASVYVLPYRWFSSKSMLWTISINLLGDHNNIEYMVRSGSVTVQRNTSSVKCLKLWYEYGFFQFSTWCICSRCGDMFFALVFTWFNLTKPVLFDGKLLLYLKNVFWIWIFKLFSISVQEEMNLHWFLTVKKEQTVQSNAI